MAVKEKPKNKEYSILDDPGLVRYTQGLIQVFVTKDYLDDQVDPVKQSITDFQEAKQEVEGKISEFTETINGLDQKIEEKLDELGTSEELKAIFVEKEEGKSLVDDATIAQITTNKDGLAALTTRVEANETAIQNKAETSAVEELTTTVSQKADQSALETLSGTVNTKADQSALEGLTVAVNSKAESSAVESLSARVTTIETQVSNVATTLSSLV